MSCTSFPLYPPNPFPPIIPSSRGYIAITDRLTHPSPSSFHNAPYGVPGNSDAGALNSWLLWQMLGLYPVVTQPVYLLQSPWFPDINVTINGDRNLRIVAHNLDNDGGSYYVQSVRVNGEAWERNWLEHGDVMVEGGVIEFEMGSEAVVWETGDVPPSPGHVILRNDTAGS